MGRTLRSSDPCPEHATLRPASRADIDALLALEAACFETDRLSRRSFRHFIDGAHADLFVAERGRDLLGYGLVLFHRGTALARLYSLAVAPAARGQRLAARLLERAEAGALEAGCVALRLEVRTDNAGAIALYETRGYRRFQIRHRYYEDQTDAWRYQKTLHPEIGGAQPRVPYLAQTTDFTCGPASLMMAMAALDPGHALDPADEIRIWREATTVFMTSGHGGCGPHGLALAALKRGFPVRVRVSRAGPLFLDTVRDPKKKDVMVRVHEAVAADLAREGLAPETGPVTVEFLEAALATGEIPLVLISTYRFNRQRAPHWVVVTGIGARFVLVHDPDRDEDMSKTDLDCMHVPIPRGDFERVARFGAERLQAAVLIGKPEARP